MKTLRIPIPHCILRAWDRFEDWGNIPVWERGYFYILRLDVLIAFGFAFCVTYYGFFNGWVGAMQGGAMYVFVSMCALWLWRR